MFKYFVLLGFLFTLNACLRTNDGVCGKYPAADLSGLAGTYQMKDQVDLRWFLEAQEDGSLMLYRGSKEQDETPIRTLACILDHYMIVEIEYPLVGDAVEYFAQSFDLSKSKIAVLKEASFFEKLEQWIGLEKTTLSLSEFSKAPQINKDDVLVPVAWPKHEGQPYAHFEVQPEGEVAFILFKEQDLDPVQTKQVLLEFLSKLSESPKRIVKVDSY